MMALGWQAVCRSGDWLGDQESRVRFWNIRIEQHISHTTHKKAPHCQLRNKLTLNLRPQFELVTAKLVSRDKSLIF